VIPLHVLAENSSVKLLHCPRCGTSLPELSNSLSAAGKGSDSAPETTGAK
jgi:hypothetical protein